MECPAPGSQLAEAARSIVRATHGVDLEHRCDVSKCRFAVCSRPLKRGGRPARLAVCTHGLHVHWCGVGVCSLARTEARQDGPWVCPISGLEVTGQAEVYCPQRRKGRGGKPDTFEHSVTPLSRRRPSVKKSKLAETRRFVEILLTSPQSEALIVGAADRRARSVSAAVCRAGNAFMAQMSAARRTCPRSILPPVPSELVAALSAAINDFLSRVRPRLAVCKGNASLVAAVVGFLATGVTSGETVIVPQVDWVRRRMPAAADLGKLPGFQCRPVSISARHIKAAVFGANGTPIASLLFRWPWASL